MTEYNAMEAAHLLRVVEDLRMQAESGGPSPDFAEALLALASKFSETGELDRALAAAIEGVDHLRLLTEADPAAYAVHMASALNNLSNRLSDMERDDEARKAGDEAVELARQALSTGDKSVEARFVLVSSLMNQSGRSWRDGAPSQAIDELAAAVRIFRDGGESLLSFLGVMVDALHQNAMALAEARMWDQAIAVRRMCSQVFPEGQAPMPVDHLLALTLQQGALAAARAGDFTQSVALVEEAAQLARDLAGADPAQYRLFLAESLAALAERRHQALAHAEALDASVEAVAVFQDLAQENPAQALGPLVPTLDTFASILTTLGHVEQAENIQAQRDQLAGVLDQLTGGA